MTKQAIFQFFNAGIFVIGAEVAAQNTQFSELRDQFLWESALHVAIANNRKDFLVYEGPNRVADHTFLFGQRRIDIEEIGGVRGEIDRRERRGN